MGIHIAVDEGVDQYPEHFGILKQGCDVAKLNAGCWPVGYGANVVSQVLVDAEVVHGEFPENSQ